MKKTAYSCDRCGRELGENGVAIERTCFCTETKVLYRFRFFGKWKSDNPAVITYELCEECRNKLDAWIDNYGM